MHATDGKEKEDDAMWRGRMTRMVVVKFWKLELELGGTIENT